ncbi:hypothetical protein JCGZ_15837 [Jatropha curcas]|uniref:Uncharacterized protein n=1 Tax=Jatropha curcas TaxID=180498 RepID=A0A067LA97_JATCU|nr:uncharacterized protein LOC105630660 isoform X2 [Jatropha curcas]KDP41430.1 hypothetical protein JCGZ_15837 [Jatropha curcas]
MLTRRSTAPYSYWRTHQRFSLNSRILLATVKHINSCQFLGNQRLKIFHANLKLHDASSKKDMVVYNGVDPGPVLPSDPSSSPGSWKMWILGMLITVVLPVWRNKWWPLLTLKDRVESVVETAEDVTDIVEKVAEKIEKVAEEVADHLPEGGKLKDAVTVVENVAKETAKDAHLVHQVIDNMQEVEKEVESSIETVIDQANEIRKEAQDQD